MVGRSMVKVGLALFMALSMAVAPQAFAQAAKKQIKISHSSAADVSNDNHMSAWIITNYINSNSDTLEAKLYPSNQLGEERAVLEAMQLGSGASVYIGGTAILGNFNKKLGVFDLPFMWRSYDHAHRVLDGPAGNMLASELEKSGFKVLAWTDSWGYRNVVTTKKQIKKPADLKGLKIRTIQTPTYVAALNAMGASATPMAFGEVYTSLQSGVLDGFEHAPSMVYSSKFYEVAKHVTLTRHLFGPTVIAFSKQEWDKLTPAEQTTVQAAAKLAQDINRNLAAVRDAEALAALQGKGMVISEINTDAFRKAAGPLQDQLAKERNASDILDIIRKTK